MKESSIVSFISVTIFQAPASKVCMYLLSCLSVQCSKYLFVFPVVQIRNHKWLDNFRLAFSDLDFLPIPFDLLLTKEIDTQKISHMPVTIKFIFSGVLMIFLSEVRSWSVRTGP